MSIIKQIEKPKTLKISEDVHNELRVHAAIKRIGMSEFAEKAIRNQIKRETPKSK